MDEMGVFEVKMRIANPSEPNRASELLLLEANSARSPGTFV
jgi:hypothetical protein